MDDFEFRYKCLEFWSISGEIINTNKYSETHVSSSGGGGYIDRFGGRIEALKIHSKNTTVHEFWIRRSDDGSELDVKLRNIDIPLRSGQQVTMIVAGLKNTNIRHYTTLVNHTAKKYWHINTTNDLTKLYKLDLPHAHVPISRGVLALSVLFTLGHFIYSVTRQNFDANLLSYLGAIFSSLFLGFVLLAVLLLLLRLIYFPINLFTLPFMKKRLQKRLDQIASACSYN